MILHYYNGDGEMKDMEKEFEGLVRNILIRAKEKLEELDESDFPFDFNSYAIHDIVHEEIDSFVSSMDRQECLAWIDWCNNEQHVDWGVIDTTNIDRILLTMAYECIRMKVFDDDLINDLQEYELTAEKRDEFLSRINKRLRDAKYMAGCDNETQIFIETEFDIKADDFKDVIDVIELGDGNIKILNSLDAEKINRNAIVFEKKQQGLYRVYLMDRDKDIDIRKYFDKKHFSDKTELLNVVVNMVSDLRRR